MRRGKSIMATDNRNDVYECVRCGNCCRWPGPVRVTGSETRGIAGFLDMPPDEFMRRYTRLVDNGKAVSLTEKPDGSCSLLEGNECLVHDVKPRQCRDFPNNWNFPGFEEECNAKRYYSAGA